jgi:phage I-like protein
MYGTSMKFFRKFLAESKQVLNSLFVNAKQQTLKYYANSLEIESLTDAGKVSEFIKVVPIGTFPTHPCGAHEITPQHIQEMALNILNSGTDVLFDFGHESLYCMNAEAAGWSPKDSVKAQADGLYIKYPEWTEAGKEKVNGKAFRYLSPVYLFNQTDKQGKEIGAVLHSVGLTNTPYMDTEIDSIGNSKSNKNFKLNSNGEEEMNPKILAFLGLTPTATEAEITTAIANSAKKYGLPETATLDAIVNAAIDEAKKASAPVTAAEYTTMKTELDAFKANAAVQLKEKAEALVNSAITKGKILPAMKDQFIQDAIKDFTAVEANLNSRADNSAIPPVVKIDKDQVDMQDPKAIANSATAYRNEQAKLGITISFTEAVNHVTKK